MDARTRWISAVLGTLLFFPAVAAAEYTIVLKNGRRLTVQAYREEGQTIKIYGSGGEIGIPRDQVQTILRAGEGEARGLDLRPPAQPSPAPAQAAEKQPTPPQGAGKDGKPAIEKPLTPEEQKALEEKEYQKKVQELTESLKNARDRYAVTTRGSAGPEPTVPTTEEQLKARNDDLISRLRDAQQSQSGIRYEPGVQQLQPGSLTGDPPPLLEPGPVVGRPGTDPIPPGYTEKQRELSDLRSRINQLEGDRKKLIDEMKQKNFDTGNLFLE